MRHPEIMEGTMKIGVNMTLSSQSIDVAILARKAESLGFESLWLPEHPNHPRAGDYALPGQRGWGHSARHE
jgi:alkanesulfonate monooxygenase SsuD/methylene tetrahydromethanopterin reductase-like flavin-dependent oxidoreductase (luciferase family)